MLDHLGSQGLSHLLERSVAEEGLAALTPADLTYVRSLPSVARYIAFCSKDERKKLKSNAETLRVKMSSWLDMLHVQRRRFALSFELLHTTVLRVTAGAKQEKDKPGLCDRRKLYGKVLEQLTDDIPELQTVFGALKVLATGDMLSLLREWLRVLKEGDKDDVDGQGSKKAIDQLQQFEHDLTDVKALQSRMAAPKAVQKGEGKGKRSKSSLNAKQRRCALLAVATQSQDAVAPVKADVSAWFQRYCAMSMAPIEMFPLHELLTCRQGGALTKLFQPQPREALQQALTHSQSYLGSLGVDVIKLGRRHRDVPSPELDDICILYQLYEEAGVNINLYDWYCTFRAVHAAKAIKAINDQSSDKRQSKKQKLEAAAAAAAAAMDDEEEEDGLALPRVKEEELQARFSRATTVLRSLGFIKPSTRKIDHVVKLSFATYD